MSLFCGSVGSAWELTGRALRPPRGDGGGPVPALGAVSGWPFRAPRRDGRGRPGPSL